MSTPILKLITEHCVQGIDDIRLNDLAQHNAPLYARKAWGYLKAAIPLFTLPLDMPEYLYGTEDEPALIEPTFDDYQYSVEEDLTADKTVELGDDYKDFELFAAHIKATDDLGNIVMVATDLVSYDSENGTITITASDEEPIEAGTIFDFDFYTDGYFANTLTQQMQNILGICFRIKWQEKQVNDFLSNIPKTEDKVFTEQNRANKMNSDNARLEAMRIQLADAMRGYEQYLVSRKMKVANKLI